MAAWLFVGVTARSFYTFTPPQSPASAPTWTAPAAYPEYVQAPYTPQYVPYAPQYEQEGWSMSNVLLVMGAGAAGVAAGVALKRPVAALAVDGDNSKTAVAVGAAAVGGIVGVYFFHELSTAAILAAVCAYGSTLNNGFGDATRSVGSAATKVYDKTVEINDQYEILGKAKSAADFTVAAASDLDDNYQISAKVDEKLKLSSVVDKAKDKLSDIKDSLPKNIGKGAKNVD